VLDPQTVRGEGGGAACEFGAAAEPEYDAGLARSLRGGVWVDASFRCLGHLLGPAASTTFVVALADTGGGRSDAFAALLAPIGLMRGLGMVRGGYKDTVLAHLAQHLVVFLGPDSELFGDHPDLKGLHGNASMSQAQVGAEFDGHNGGWVQIQPISRAWRNPVGGATLGPAAIVPGRAMARLAVAGSRVSCDALRVASHLTKGSRSHPTNPTVTLDKQRGFDLPSGALQMGL
jgi:hypothetical protein